METVRDLFQKFKGPAALGSAIGKSTEHATSMRARNSITLTYWPALIAAVQERGIALDEATLVRIHLALAEGETPSDQAASHAA